jgi:predicted acetyltransferase
VIFIKRKFSSINKTDRRHDIAEILLKAALNTIKQRNIKQTKQMV